MKNYQKILNFNGFVLLPKIFESSSCHHKPDVIRVDDDEKSKKLLQKFFQLKRKKSLN